jgi:F-type H+-transporting ATPase subunit b
MEIAQQFGINWVLLAAQIVNFLIVLFILKKLLYKPVQEMLRNREKTIKEGLKQAEEARVLLEQTAEREREVLRKAQQEAKKLLEETKQQRVQMMAESEILTKKQAEAILKEARSQIAFESAQTEKRLTAHISQLAVTFLQKSIADLFSEEDQERIMKNAVKKLQDKAN